MVFAVVAASLLAEPYLIGYHKGMAANEIRGYKMQRESVGVELQAKEAGGRNEGNIGGGVLAGTGGPCDRLPVDEVRGALQGVPDPSGGRELQLQRLSRYL